MYACVHVSQRQCNLASVLKSIHSVWPCIIVSDIDGCVCFEILHKRRVNRSCYRLHSLISILSLELLENLINIISATVAFLLHSITFIRTIFRLFISIRFFFHCEWRRYVYIDDISFRCTLSSSLLLLLLFIIYFSLQHMTFLCGLLLF